MSSAKTLCLHGLGEAELLQMTEKPAKLIQALYEHPSIGVLEWENKTTKPGNIFVYPFPKQAVVFMCLQYKSFENTAGKGEIAPYEQFSFSHSVFYPFGKIAAIFIKAEIVVCKVCKFERV